MRALRGPEKMTGDHGPGLLAPVADACVFQRKPTASTYACRQSANNVSVSSGSM